MTHTEQISVYRYQKADDGFGEYLPAAPVLQTLAPTWATVNNQSGNDVIFSERFATNNQFEVICNWRADFTWTRDMFIVTRFGNLDVTGIQESIRKRQMTIDAVYISGVDDTGSGTPSVSGLTTLYYSVPADSSTLTLPTIDGKTIYLLFRDGVEKKVVANNPQINEVMISDDILSLVTDDIFYTGERITILYQ